MLTSGEINIIGNVLNTTWGIASSERGRFPLGSAVPASVTAALRTVAGPSLSLPLDVIKRERGTSSTDESHQLIVTYTDVVTFSSDQELHASMKRFNQIAQKTCAMKLDDLKKQFRGAAGRGLKIKLIDGHDSVQPFSIPTPEISLIARPVLRPQIFRGYYRYTGVYSLA